MNRRLWSVGVLCATLTQAAAAPSASEEMAMKAEAIITLPRYVEWPPSAFVISRTPIMIGVYGQSKLHELLSAAAEGKMINGRTVMVRQFYWPQIPNAHLLYIAPSERHHLPWIMKKLQHTTVLTVAEFDDFLPSGGMVRLSTKDEKVRFHVNLPPATQANLKFSAKFLMVADQVIAP